MKAIFVRNPCGKKMLREDAMDGAWVAASRRFYCPMTGTPEMRVFRKVAVGFAWVVASQEFFLANWGEALEEIAPQVRRWWHMEN